MVYRDGIGDSRTRALTLYGSQLLLNWMWTPIFFSWHKLDFVSMTSCFQEELTHNCFPRLGVR